LAPCELCLLQRWPWMTAVAVSLIAVLVGGRPVLPWVALLLALVFATSVVLAAYHVGVEQKWVAAPSACTASSVGKSSGAMTLEEMKRQILGTAPVMCDRIQWSLFGVSLAGWNLLASLIMAAICIAAFARGRRPVQRLAAAT